MFADIFKKNILFFSGPHLGQLIRNYQMLLDGASKKVQTILMKPSLSPTL